jgi:uncharacterized membrane protein YvbJ
MFCPNCGSEVSEKAVICVKCGVALNKSVSSNNNTNGNAQPKTWLVESILVTLFCCLPLGIAGIVNASNVSSKFASGDIDGANRASIQAAKWTKWGLIAGIIGLVLYFGMILLFGGFAAML